mgnify:CR=1 FL=1|jgi:Predicted O-methyltransferase
MLKRVYISAAQTLLAVPMSRYYATAAHSIAKSYWQRWFASLGAIYHLDRMVALDIPWWNVAATCKVEEFLRSRPKARVFEFGSGASTIWLARRSGQVTSVEHNAVWANALESSLASHSNVKLLRAAYDASGNLADQPYVNAITGDGLYDLIVIDGRLRTACLAAAIPMLQPHGIILFDDSGRSRYRRAINECGLKEEHFRGLSYCVPYPDHSSILHTA